MKLDLICGKQDEFFTPRYAIDPILRYIPQGARIWCPFDTEESIFVKEFRKRGNPVTASHIKDGRDFFRFTPKNFDMVVSNPPYSLKGPVIKRLFKIGKPFAMLVGVVGLFESQERFEMFRDNPFEILYMNRRIAYFENYGDENPKLNPPFYSVYICKGILPKQIVFEEIQKGRK